MFIAVITPREDTEVSKDLGTNIQEQEEDQQTEQPTENEKITSTEQKEPPNNYGEDNNSRILVDDYYKKNDLLGLFLHTKSAVGRKEYQENKDARKYINERLKELCVKVTSRKEELLDEMSIKHDKIEGATFYTSQKGFFRKFGGLIKYDIIIEGDIIGYYFF